MNFKKYIFWIILLISIPIVLGIAILVSFVNTPVLIAIFIAYLFIYEKFVRKKD